ncbi:MAG: DUF2892 domain-containing protein [Thiobacillus sp.]|uniref:YgaP family membrane protein n=1 Tax=Thiobacillus sp. TaxID=924 RepID=UPI00168C2211|nr:MAG: DUF2892 domain-containing protein [Thiobacillus sp.]
MAGRAIAHVHLIKRRKHGKNVGGVDRIVRAVVGIALIGYAMSNLPGAENWMVPAGIVGFVVLLTAIFGFCPAYLPFGIKTCKTK